MSIIHEALKKVQSNRSQTNKDSVEIIAKPQAKETPSPSPAAPARVAVKKPVPVAPSPPLSISVTTLLWSGTILALTIFSFFNLSELSLRINDLANLAISSSITPTTPRIEPTVAGGVEPTLAAAETPAITPAPAAVTPPPAPVTKPKRKKGEIILSGITVMDGKNIALINDGIYETGEEVEGATITRITDASVIILQRGKTRILKVTHQ